MCISVLLADDKEIIRQAIRKLLADNPEVQLIGEAADFAQTIQMTQELKPNVVVMDLHLADFRNGENISDMPLGKSRLLAMSLANDEEAIVLAESLGAIRLLDKMNLYDELIPAIIELGAPSANAASAGK
jgi:DNA-binding NarL/FixJ family response regulator